MAGMFGWLRRLVTGSANLQIDNAVARPDPQQLGELYGNQSVWLGLQKWVDGDDGHGSWVRDGKVIDEQTAFEVSVVWACLDIQARHIAASDWFVIERTGRRRTKELVDDPLTYLLNLRPNSEMSAQAFKRALTISMLSWGNGYAEIARDAANRVAGFYPIHPSRVTLVRTADGIEFKVDQGGNTYSMISQENMIHVKGPSIIGFMGMNKIGLAAGTIALTIAANDFSSALFRNGGRPGGVLETPQKLGDEEYKTLKKRWAERHEGPEKAFKVALLDRGMKFTSVPTDASKGQTVESRQFQIEEIARLWGVPPHKIGHLVKASESNIEHQGKAFVNDCLRPIAVEFQQEFDFKCLQRRGRFIRSKIDLDWVMEGTFKERMEGFREARNTGVLNANEIRDVFGYDSMGPDGDLYIVQGAMIGLGDVGLPYKPDPGAPPAEPVEPDDDDSEDDDVQQVMRAWISSIYARSERCMVGKIRQCMARGDNPEEAKEKGLAEGAKYLQRAIAELRPQLKSRHDDAFLAGMKVLTGTPIRDAARIALGEPSEKPAAGAIQKQGEGR